MSFATSSMQDAFMRKKSSILHQLAAPEEEYTDRSVKGTVDEPISELINEINAYDDLVTTSSCSGRISVFLEGPPKDESESDLSAKINSRNNEGIEDEGRPRQNNEIGDGAVAKSDEIMRRKKKRKGGKWLYMSHGNLDVDGVYSTSTLSHLHALFGMRPSRHSRGNTPNVPTAATRFVHFKFEPMVSFTVISCFSNWKEKYNIETLYQQSYML